MRRQDMAEQNYALNDIVISRCGSLQVLTFQIYVNGQFLFNRFLAARRSVPSPPSTRIQSGTSGFAKSGLHNSGYDAA